MVWYCLRDEHIAGIRITNLFADLAANFHRLLAIQYTSLFWLFCAFFLVSLSSAVWCFFLGSARALLCIYGYLVGQIMCNYRSSIRCLQIISNKFELLYTWRSIEFIHTITSIQQAKIVYIFFGVLLHNIYACLASETRLNITHIFVCTFTAPSKSIASWIFFFSFTFFSFRFRWRYELK